MTKSWVNANDTAKKPWDGNTNMDGGGGHEAIHFNAMKCNLRNFNTLILIQEELEWGKG